MKLKELLQAIKENRLADYVSANYWKLSKEQLKDITLQVIYTMYDNGIKDSKIDIVELLDRLDLEDW